MAVGLSDREFARRCFIAAAAAALVAVAVLLLWRAAPLLVLLFAGLLLAVFFSALAEFTQRRLPRLSYRAALGLVLVALAIVVGGFWALAGPALSRQASELADQLPRAIDQLQAKLSQFALGRAVLARGPEALSSGELVLDWAREVLAGSVRAIGGLLVFLFAGLFLAFEPGLYFRGLLHLVPLARRPRAGAVLDEMHHTLRWWLIGRAISMAIVGVLVWTGLAIVGVPLALVLGVVAGLLDFVPYFGPILAAVPGVLLGLVEGVEAALYVAGVYTAVQLVENYVVSPVVERKTVLLPPALTMGFQLVMGLVAGVVGAALASPLLAALLVVVKRVYVEDVLGDRVG